jgi:hypothetical protein
MRGNKGNMHRNMTGNMLVIMCINTLCGSMKGSNVEQRRSDKI